MTSQKILVIDDDKAMRESLRDLLSLEKFECETAGSGAEGMALLNANPPSIVVVDVQLPDTNGYQFTQELKKNAATRNIPIIMISGRFTEPSDRIQGLEIGADEYFLKPFDPLLFIARIKNFVRSLN